MIRRCGGVRNRRIAVVGQAGVTGSHRARSSRTISSGPAIQCRKSNDVAIAAERVLVVAREPVHDPLRTQAQIVACLVDRQVFRPGHGLLCNNRMQPVEQGGGAYQRPKMVKSTNDPMAKLSYRPLRTARATKPLFLPIF